MRLGRKERCPIHKSLFCCGREQTKAKRSGWAPVQRIEDPHHPRGYREIRSPAEMKKLLKWKIVEQKNHCGICGEPFTDIHDVVPDHKNPKAWDQQDEMTIPITFKQLIANVIWTKGRRGCS